MATRNLFFVRHGQYHRLEYTGPEERLTLDQINALDGGLTGIGKEQAALTAERFRGRPIAALYCSTLPRAAETADIIAAAFAGIPTECDQTLWECIPSVPAEFAEHFQNISVEDITLGRARAAQVYDHYFRPAHADDRQELIVAHGNLIRYLVCRALHVTVDAWLSMYTNHCGVTQFLVREDGSVRLVSYNDVGHLPPELVT